MASRENNVHGAYARTSVDARAGAGLRRKARRTDRLDVFPAFHKVAGRRVVVIGNGGEAAAKVRLLAETNAHIVVVSPAAEADLLSAVEKADAELIVTDFVAEHLAGAALVFSARDDAALDRAAVEASRSRGIPVNAVDKPELCDFYTGALVNRAPVAVAITSSGVGPVFARHIRARIETMLPRETGALARLAEGFRDTVGRFVPSAEGRRRLWAAFFSGAVSRAIHAGKPDEARAAAQRLVNGVGGECNAEEGFVWLVGAGPGAEDLLTLRAQRLLQEADVIVHDRLVPDAVIAMGRRDAQRICVGKAKGAHSHSQQRINEILVEQARAGKRVVRLKAGDPLVFGRAGEEIAALREASVTYEIVPGITAALAAAASAEIPLTLRGVASSLVFATGHDQYGETLPEWAGLALSGATVAVYMGRTVAGRVAARLEAVGLAATTPVMAIENATRRDEVAYAGSLCDLCAFGARDGIAGPVLIVIGDVVARAALERAVPLDPARTRWRARAVTAARTAAA